MFPVYYVTMRLSEQDIFVCKDTWKRVSVDSNPHFVEQKSNNSYDDFPYNSSKIWFLKTYFERLFDIHPLAK
jgi:hypothetical protein